jgi:hypothetical protein
MGVFAGAAGRLDFSAISNQMRPLPEAWMNGEIQIVDPNVRNTDWDVRTNKRVNGSPNVLVQTKARIQPRVPLSATRGADVGFQENMVRFIKIAIPLEAYSGFIAKGLQVIVVDGGEDQSLNGMVFVVRTAVNSAQAWVRTIDCEADLSSNANAPWATVSGRVSDEQGDPIQGVQVISMKNIGPEWLAVYETETDRFGNYELPADVDEPIIVGAFADGYDTVYYEDSETRSGATVIVPENHVETSGIDLVMRVG